SGARSTGEWLTYLLERDDNAFSRAAAGGARISDTMKKQVEKELATFKLLSRVAPEAFAVGFDFLPQFEAGGFSLTYEKLLSFYLANGCGALAHGEAFAFTEKGFGEIQVAPVSLSDIKNYAEEKAELVKNTENFVNGLPSFHALLYGDCGTGKSTTVRAVAARFKDKLKTVELDSRRLDLLRELLARLSEDRQKFIVL
ncbi:MAG: ATP-binding protein, partial [Clostridiales bacterium]|nr:ATP-binding protein [Clostridiales bacterium]